LNLHPGSDDGRSRFVPLIAGLIALLGLVAVTTAALGSWDGGSRLECAQPESVRDCVYDEPETEITQSPGDLTNDRTPSFSFDSPDQEDTAFTCRLDGERTPKCGSPYTAATLDEGEHTFSVMARSNGHTPDSTPAEQTFTVDATPPVTTLLGEPIGLTKDNTPSFAFKSNEIGSSFQCKVDGAAFAPCSSPKATAALNDGQHTFTVRAIDAAHNVDPTPVSRTFTVDATPPLTTITGGPIGPTNDNTPTFSFNSNEGGSTFQCRVDNGSFANCSSPRAIPRLSDGPHTFAVRATDRAGNVDASPATRAIVVDATPPSTTITSGPSGSITDTTPTFAFKSSEAGGSFQCRVDGAAYTGCASPKTTAPLSLGNHSFSVRAIDNAGHMDPTPAVRGFTVKRSR
jgi:hypothetical protein